MSAVWRLAGGEILLDRPCIAGILNVTPDSFSDGGRFLDPCLAAEHGVRMVEEGATLIDVGAESTRPDADPVSAGDEWARLRPVLELLRDLPVPISVDTSKRWVAERALDLGAGAINDVTGLRGDPEIATLAARAGAGLVIMHMRGTPKTMQLKTTYNDVVREVRDALAMARRRALDAGCHPDTIAVDPGIGFGKSVSGNLEIISRLGEIVSIGAPVWMGASRKSFLGVLLGAGPDERVFGSVQAAVVAARNGANVLRVHDVAATRDALLVDAALAEVVPARETESWGQTS